MREVAATVIANTAIADRIFRMELELSADVGCIQAGQFVNLSVGRDDCLLKRPFGICSHNGSRITICYQLAGIGTDSLSDLKEGDTLSATLPLGKGFDLGSAQRIALVGGGVGIFPLAAVVEQYSDRTFDSFIGYRSKAQTCYDSYFADHSRECVLLTDDGSFGAKGNSITAFEQGYETNKYDLILACGPKPMLRALKALLSKRGITTRTQVSCEERMGCGIGACLVCVCDKSGGGKLRVCKDGPVFDIWEVEL